MSNLPPIERETSKEDVAKRFIDHVTNHAVEPDTDLENHPVLYSLLTIDTPGPIPCDTVYFHIGRYYADDDSEEYESIYTMTFMIRDATIHEVVYDGTVFYARIGNAEDENDENIALGYAERIVSWADEYLGSYE